MITERSTLTCRRARLHIALAVGGDLDADGEAVMNAHLVDCPSCLDYRQEMTSNLRPLHDPDDPPVYKPHDSVWPDLAERLPARSAFSLLQFNGWWVALTVCVASLAIAMFWQDQSVGNWGETAISEANGPGRGLPGSEAGSPSDVYQSSVANLSKAFQQAEPKAPPPKPDLFRLPDSGILLPILPEDPLPGAMFRHAHDLEK